MNYKEFEAKAEEFKKAIADYENLDNKYNQLEDDMYEAREKRDEYEDEMWEKFELEEEKRDLVKEERCKSCGQVTKETRVVYKGANKAYEKRRKAFQAELDKLLKPFEDAIQSLEREFDIVDDEREGVINRISDLEYELSDMLNEMFRDMDVDVSVRQYYT